MRRRSSVEGVDTAQEAQGCPAGEARTPDQYSMKKALCHDSVMTPCIIILDLTLTRHFTAKES